MCTAYLPRLRNYLSQVSHCKAPRCSLMGFGLSRVHLCLFLSPSLRNDLPHSWHRTCFDCCTWALCSSLMYLSLTASRYIARHPCLDDMASSSHSSSAIPLSRRSVLMTSLHLFLGPPLGRGCGSHPKRHLHEVRVVGIRARWPSHSKRRAVTIAVTVVRSPQRCLISCDVICCSHCCWFVMPSTILMHLWWKESNLFMSFLRGVQHSDP